MDNGLKGWQHDHIWLFIRGKASSGILWWHAECGGSPKILEDRSVISLYNSLVFRVSCRLYHRLLAILHCLCRFSQNCQGLFSCGYASLHNEATFLLQMFNSSISASWILFRMAVNEYSASILCRIYFVLPIQEGFSGNFQIQDNKMRSCFCYDQKSSYKLQKSYDGLFSCEPDDNVLM